LEAHLFDPKGKLKKNRGVSQKESAGLNREMQKNGRGTGGSALYGRGL